LAVRGEFGYWVFEGDLVPAQRPSWNYRAEDGGGIILDMMCHWRYVLDNLFGAVRRVSCIGTTHIPQRWDENGKPYKATAGDACPTTSRTTTRSRCNGSSLFVTSSTTSHSGGRCAKARRACNSSNARSRAGRSAAGSTYRSCRSEHSGPCVTRSG